MSTGTSARLLTAAAALTLAATGCATTVELNDPNRLYRPQNAGANGDVRGVHIRNAFLLGGPEDATASPSGGQALYAVLINDRDQPDRLEKVTVEGGGNVRLAGPVEMRPHEAASKPNQPIGTATGTHGAYVPMTFSFRDAGEVRLTVPVMPREGEYSDLPSSPAGPPTPTSTPSPKKPGTSPKPTRQPEHATGAPG